MEVISEVQFKYQGNCNIRFQFIRKPKRMRGFRVGLILLIAALLLACTAISKFTPEQRAEFEKAIAELNTPEKINVWLVKNFTYDLDLYFRETNLNVTEQSFWNDYIKWPIETYFNRKGVCHDAANLAGYALTKAGYEVKIVTARNDLREIHTVCAFRRDGKWWICGDTRFFLWIPGPFNSIKEVAIHIARGGKLTEHSLTRRKGF